MSSKNRRSIRPKAAECGVQLAELAIVLPILLLLLAAIAEFGNYFYTYTTLDKATRVAARYLAAHSDFAGEMNNAKNMAVCGATAACGGKTVLNGFGAGNVEITYSGTSSTNPGLVTVRITGYTYQPVFDLGKLAGGASWKDVNVSPSTTMLSTVVR
ncbi:MAG: TadE/TadG family type IV pilus assembly protein [Blastocatellia bacterium]